MARIRRTTRNGGRAVPEVPYYAPDAVVTEEVVGTATTVEDTVSIQENRGAALWLLIGAVAVLIVGVAYFATRDDKPAEVVTPTPSPVVTTVIVVPGQQPPAPPPVIINQPPVVVQQPPASQAPATTNPSPTSS